MAGRRQRVGSVVSITTWVLACPFAAGRREHLHFPDEARRMVVGRGASVRVGWGVHVASYSPRWRTAGPLVVQPAAGTNLGVIHTGGIDIPSTVGSRGGPIAELSIRLVQDGAGPPSTSEFPSPAPGH